MILTDEEIAEIVVEMNGNEPKAPFWRDLARAIESAVFAKLASAELPEPIGYEVSRAMCEPYLNYSKVKGALQNTKLYTADQLRQAYAQGAAAQITRLGEKDGPNT